MSYEDLVVARKTCRLCAELVNPAHPSHAQFDGPEVGPWSLWLASRPAKVALVGQDWGTVGYFRDYRGRDVPENLTNKRLIELLAALGLEVGPPNQTDRHSGVFATNAILCLKPGEANALSGSVRERWYSACRPLLKWTVEETSAPTIIALGRRAYEAMAAAFQIDPPQFPDCVASPIKIDNERTLFAVFHPAARPVNRTFSQMLDDWTRIADYRKGNRPSAAIRSGPIPSQSVKSADLETRFEVDELRRELRALREQAQQQLERIAQLEDRLAALAPQHRGALAQ